MNAATVVGAVVVGAARWSALAIPGGLAGARRAVEPALEAA